MNLLECTPTRLNLGGCGEGKNDSSIPGFATVDLRDVADIRSSADDLSFMPDASIEEIYASNILEHFPHPETNQVLSEWFRVLKPGGILWVSVPDFDANVKLYLKEGLCEWVRYLLWGDQKHPLNYHYINFTFATLAKALIDSGFSDVVRVKEFPHGIRDASTIQDSKYGIMVSLNVKATK